MSEIFWAGSEVSTADEWVELFGISSSGLTTLTAGAGVIDLSGWTLTSQNSSGEEVLIHQFASGTLLGSGRFLLISNYPAAESALAIEPDIVTTAVSLPNEKLLLRLYDGSGILQDSADDGVGAPLAGFNKTASGVRASMERLYLKGSLDILEEWVSAETFSNFDSGSLLLGTPGLALGEGLPKNLLPFGVSSISSASSSQSGAFLSSESSSSELTQSSSTNSEQDNNVSPIYKDIFITEVLANPTGSDDQEWIEIGYFGSGALTLSGFALRVGSRSFVFTDSASLSGSLVTLDSGQHLAVPKAITGLPLRNAGDTVRLLAGSVLLDELTYPETAEAVSFGRPYSGSGTLQPFCVPTPNQPNQVLDLPVRIEVQTEDLVFAGSGVVIGTGSLTLNVAAKTASGSLSSAHCSWQFTDGFTSDSCNPSSHKITQEGPGFITLNVTTYCNTTVTQILPYFVYPKPKQNGKVAKNFEEEKAANQCFPAVLDGISISEIYPNPVGDETEGEWIELRNENPVSASLCGWSLDDEPDGSKPADLQDVILPPDSYTVVPRTESKLALNNPGDSVRLFAPGQTEPRQTVTFLKATEGESYAFRDDGYFVWTPYLTPGQPNRFRTAERQFPTDRVVVAAALPNPAGPDEEGEWIELQNVSDAAITLDGWQLDNKPGGSAPFALSGLLPPGKVRRYLIGETKLSLVNSSDQVRLLDPDGYVASTFGWTEAVEGRIYRRPVIVTERAKAKVTTVVDGDTIDIILTEPDQLDRLPSSLKRRWLGQENGKPVPIRVRLIGIDTPETVHPSKPVQAYGKQASDFTKNLLQGAAIELAFDEELWDKYDRLLAYAYLPDGETIQAKLLRAGLAYAYLRFPFLFREEFIAYEREAQSAKLGLWSDEETSEYAFEQQEYALAEAAIEKEGLGISAKPPPGIVEAGTLIRFLPTVPATLFLSVDSGAWLAFSGSYLIENDIRLAVYAERETGSGIVRSGTLDVSYALARDHYESEAVISEVFPAPAAGEPEWIELWNPTDYEVSLAGWLLDDVRGAGSRAHAISPAHRIAPGGFLLLTNDQTGLALNNDGDEVWLTSPDEKMAAGFSYGKIKKAQAATSDCITDVPTPGEPNVCVSFLPAKQAPDEDHDLLPDDRETWLYRSDPQNPDTDGDGWLDGFETSIGESPVTATGSVRSIREQYQEYVLQKVKPSWQLYKRKGLVVKGKAYPTQTVTAMVKGERGYADVSVDGSFELIIPPPLPAGVHIVNVEIEDAVGRIIPTTLVIELQSDYVSAPAKKSVRSLLGAIKQRYRNLIFGAESHSGAIMALPAELRALQELSLMALESHQNAPVSPAAESGVVAGILALGTGLVVWKRRW